MRNPLLHNALGYQPVVAGSHDLARVMKTYTGTDNCLMLPMPLEEGELPSDMVIASLVMMDATFSRHMLTNAEREAFNRIIASARGRYQRLTTVATPIKQIVQNAVAEWNQM